MLFTGRVLVFITLALSAVIPSAAARAQEDAAKVAVVGQPSPLLVTPTLDGKSFDLSSLKGKVVVIHLWATWCPPCREEMPALEAVWRHYHGSGLEVLALSADRPRARGDVDQVMHTFTFPAALLNNVTKNEFGIPRSIPITYVIDKGGNIAAILTPDVASLTETGLGTEVKTLLDAKADMKSDAKTDGKPDPKADGADPKIPVKDEPKP